MFIFFMVLFSSLCLFIKFFKKKLMVLLSMELMFVSIIGLYFFFSFGSMGSTSFFSCMVFLTFMVLDSVLGLCILISCTRNSTYFSDFFFGL